MTTDTFTSLADLASARVGGRAVGTNDDFFAPMANLVKPDPAIFIPGKFTALGKWMDGWESRRRRTPGHDWCVVRLGIRGVVKGLDVDTSHFTGNFPSHCSLDGLDATGPLVGAPGLQTRGRTVTKAVCAADGAPWTPLLTKTPLTGNGHNLLTVNDARPWTHVRLNIFPDGGVARLRVHGEAEIDWARIARAGRVLDLGSILNGGLVLGASDMHFGAKDNLIMPGRSKNMGDGWETRRRRGPGFDWAIVRLGAPGTIKRIEIDTNHFKGNYPESASIEACIAPGASFEALSTSAAWIELLPRTKLRAHHQHFYSREIRRIGAVSHVRLNMFPDGGISRLRLHGIVAPR